MSAPTFEQTLAKCYRTDPADRAEAEAAVRALLITAGIDAEIADPEKICWELSPPRAPRQIGYHLQAELDRSWITYYLAAAGLPQNVAEHPELLALAQALERVIDACHGVYFCTDRAIVLCDRPEVFTVDELGRLHSRDGKPSLAYRDGLGTYHWHGIRMPGAAIRDPRSITVEQIASESNQEVCRALIGLYGEGRWLLDSGAVPIDESDWGRLYQLPAGSLIVRVDDGVPQLDGSRPTYTLRVDSQCRPMKRGKDGTVTYGKPQKRTALAAVASTYGMTASEYAGLESRT